MHMCVCVFSRCLPLSLFPKRSRDLKFRYLYIHRANDTWDFDCWPDVWCRTSSAAISYCNRCSKSRPSLPIFSAESRLNSRNKYASLNSIEEIDDAHGLDWDCRWSHDSHCFRNRFCVYRVAIHVYSFSKKCEAHNHCAIIYRFHESIRNDLFLTLFFLKIILYHHHIVESRRWTVAGLLLRPLCCTAARNLFLRNRSFQG